MSGTQMFLVIGAILLFALLTLNVNRTILLSQDQEVSSEFIMLATSSAQNLMSQITTKAFDEGTILQPAYSAAILTPPANLGPETGEVASKYDDIDDYNLYTKSEVNLRGGTFNLKVWVNYVNDNNFDVIMSTKTRTKRIKIASQNASMTDTLFIYSYKFY